MLASLILTVAAIFAVFGRRAKQMRQRFAALPLVRPELYLFSDDDALASAGLIAEHARERASRTVGNSFPSPGVVTKRWRDKSGHVTHYRQHPEECACWLLEHCSGMERCVTLPDESRRQTTSKSQRFENSPDLTTTSLPRRNANTTHKTRAYCLASSTTRSRTLRDFH